MPDGAVRACGVVPGLEFGEQVGELFDRVRQRACFQPAFERLVEAFDLPQGLRVSGAAVLPKDAVRGEELLESAAGAVGEEPVGDVGLPAFVGQVGLEADVGAAGAFAGWQGRSAQPGAGRGGSWTWRAWDGLLAQCARRW